MRRLFQRYLLAVLALALPLVASPNWRLTRSDHFQVYAQSTDQRARSVLAWLEQLRAFFEQNGAAAHAPALPVRVIVFASEQEYQPYRLRATADAYYAGNGSQDYIVLGSDDPAKFGLAAHEYAHLALRTAEHELPPWLKEGLAEFLATLRITAHGAELGGPLPGRIRTLQTRIWMPLSEVLSLSEDARALQQRSAADLFYAESWALTEMLLLSPQYAPRFQQILASPHLNVETLTRDLHHWMDQPKLPVVELPEVVAPPVHVEVSDVPSASARLVLAQILLAAGEFDRALTQFSALSDSAETSAALGAIALHKGDLDAARRAWKRAIAEGIADAQLCYNYAILADQAGLSAADIRPALQRAIALQPDFDDAHFQLALLEKNVGRYEAALEQFQAMRTIADTRAFAYWLALADAFNELGRRDEAQSAARHAAEHATTASERARAAEQIYIAQTDPGVQFARDASGRLQLVTTRMPHQQADWNPFIQPDDDMRRIQGKLVAIDCASVTTFHVEESGRLVTLLIPDLQHVQMRHAPPDFVCGPQPETSIVVDYARTATQGIVRGIDFPPALPSPAAAP